MVAIAPSHLIGANQSTARASRMHLRTPGVGAADRLKFNCQSTDNYLTSTIAVSCEVALESVTSQLNWSTPTKPGDGRYQTAVP